MAVVINGAYKENESTKYEFTYGLPYPYKNIPQTLGIVVNGINVEWKV